MKNTLVILIGITNVWFIFEYIKNILKKPKSVSLPMWMTIALSVSLSLMTYFIDAQEFKWQKAFLNLTDFSLTLAVLGALLYVRHHEINLSFRLVRVHRIAPLLLLLLFFFENILLLMVLCIVAYIGLCFVEMIRAINYKAFLKQFTKFEKRYFILVLLLFVFWVITRSAFWAGVYAQVMVGLGFVPLYVKVYETKTIDEPLFAWILAVVLSLLGLVLAYGNILMMLYTIRSTLLCLIVILLIILLPKSEEVHIT